MRRLLPLALLLASLPAAARKGDPDLGKKTESGGPSVDLAGEVVRPKTKDVTADKPTLGYEQFRFQVELQLKEKRADLVATLRRMLELGNDPKEKPDLLFRLAELNWEEAKYWFFESNRREGEAITLDEKGDSAGARSARAEKKTDEERRLQFQTQAIAYYQEIISTYPTFERIDEVLFFLGHNLWESGQERKALAAYKQLVTRFPKSKYIPDAYLAFGEYYFNESGGRRDMLNKALEAYSEAATHTESAVYGFAIYKQGWCKYNLVDYAGAASKFRAVVLYGKASAEAGGDRKLALVREARKDFVLAYSRFGDPTGALAAFNEVGGPENGLTMLESLADLYYADGKDKEAVLVYRQLIREQPLSVKAPFFQGRIVDAVRRVGNKALTVEQARLLVKIFEDVAKANLVKSDADHKSIDAARDLAERTLSSLAVTWHNEAKKTRDDETFGHADDVYRDYLTIFPSGSKAYDLRFFHAELLYENLHRYKEAAAEYDRVVATDAALVDANQKPGRWLTRAAEGALFSYDQGQRKAPELETATKDSVKPRPIPAEEQATLAACQAYLRFVPNGDKRVQAAYEAARIAYRYNHFDEAVKRFSEIALEHPEDDLAIYSANLVLDTFNLLTDYEGLDTWAKKFYAEPRLAKGAFKTELLKIIERNAFKLVEAMEKKDDFSPAGDRFLQFVADWPGSELADKALFNASVDYYKARRFEDAVAVRERIFKEYPRSDLAPKAMLQSASQYEEIGDLSRAARGYEAYFAGWEKTQAPPVPARKHGRKKAPPPPARASGFEAEKARTALFDAAVLREGLGDLDLSIAERQKYLAFWPGVEDAETVALSLADLQDRRRHYGSEIETLSDYLGRHAQSARKSLVAQRRIADASARMNRKTEKDWTRIWQTFEKLSAKARADVLADPAAADAVAEAHLRLSEPVYRAFERIQLRLPQNILARSLKAKGQALLGVQKRYTETVALTAPGPAVCALGRIAGAYKGFARALYDAPVPPGLKSDEVDAYRAALGEQAAPVEAKAVEALESAVQKARELGVHNECAREARKALAEAAPDKFPEIIEPIASAPDLAPLRQAPPFVDALRPRPHHPSQAAVPARGATASQPPPSASNARPRPRPSKAAPPTEQEKADPAQAPRPTAPVSEPPVDVSGEDLP